MNRSRGLAVTLLALLVPALAGAEAIQTDMAMTPASGVTLSRTILRYTLMDEDPTPMDREMRRIELNQFLLYGVDGKLMVGLRLPAVRTEMEMGGNETETEGIGDLLLIAKRKIAQWDRRGGTTRIALIGALDIPSGADRVSGHTMGPRLGAIFTHTGLPGGRIAELHADAMMRIRPRDGEHDPGDMYMFDLAGSYQIWPWSTSDSLIQLVAELNARVMEPDRIGGLESPDGGGTVVWASPGLIYLSRRVVVEAGLQIPIVRNLRGDALEPTIAFAAGVRFQY